jgi:hypothetical protein
MGATVADKTKIGLQHGDGVEVGGRVVARVEIDASLPAAQADALKQGVAQAMDKAGFEGCVYVSRSEQTASGWETALLVTSTIVLD